MTPSLPARSDDLQECHDLLEKILLSLEDGTLFVPEVIHAAEATIKDLIVRQNTPPT